MKSNSTIYGLSMAVVLQLAVLAASAQTYKCVYTGSETNITLAPGTYIITAYGAEGGGGSGGAGGLGAEMSGEFTFSTNTTITLLVGGGGGGGFSFGGGLSGGGGGGGSFVVNGSKPLVIAGGGGGGGGSVIDSSAITNLAEASGIASPDDSPNGEIIIFEVSSTLLSEPPAIGITTVSNQPVIVWPASATYYVLQMTTNLASGNWATMTNGIPFIGLQITNAPGASFFQLAL
jgi:hypothetical protein